MKILIYGINFSPELTGIGKYTGEMADWFAAQGHEVRVVTAPPYYPAWKVVVPYTDSQYRREKRAVGVYSFPVWRCPLWVPARVSGAKRMLHLASFALTSLPVMLRQAVWRPDVVWMAAPALMCAPGAWLTARLSGAKAAIHIQDFEVDAAFQLGLLKSPVARRFALWCERTLLRRFDIVSTISGRMMDLARAKGVVPENLVFFPNWVDLAAVTPAGPVSTSNASGVSGGYRAELGIPRDAVVALYSGNMGMKQGLEILPEVARLCGNAENSLGLELYFVFCGQGAGRPLLEEACRSVPNVRLLPLQPAERLGELLTMADIHLLPQRADAADLVMPSKLTGMLASARPVIATAGTGTELAQVVNGCGLVVEPENAQAMADAVCLLAKEPEIRRSLGEAGRAWAEQNLDRDAVLRKYEKVLAAG